MVDIQCDEKIKAAKKKLMHVSACALDDSFNDDDMVWKEYAKKYSK